MSTYLDVLMKTSPPEGQTFFVKSKEPERIIVPVKNDCDETSVDSKEKVKREFVPRNKNALRKNSKKRSDKKKSPKDKNFIKAIVNAQQDFMKLCRPSKNDDAVISQALQY